MEETNEQKIIRNIQGNFAVFKTQDVSGEKTMIPNIEWENPEEIDKFFMFAKNMGAKVIYLTEADEEDEETGQVRNTIIQVGFINQGIMHHINFVEDDDEDDDDEDEYEEEEESSNSVENSQNTVSQQQVQPNQQSQQGFNGPSNF